MKVTKTLLRLQNMAQAEILTYIPAGKLDEIKANDQNPLFKVFSIAHEGISNGTVIGLGKTALRWLQNSVAKIYEKLRPGTALFYDHEPGTNSHKGRTKIGEVISKAKQVISDTVHTVAITYIYPEFRKWDLDVASFEGDVTLPENLLNTPTIDPADIGEITGIALGNSAKMQPAFSNATLQGALQMMAENGEKKMKRNLQNDIPENLTFAQVLEYVKTQKVQPSDLFGADALKEDQTVQGIIKDGNKDTYHQAKRLEIEKAALKDKYDQEKKDLEEKLKNSLAKNAQIEAKDLTPEIFKERKLDEISQKFINKKLDKEFKPEDPENTKAELNKFIDVQVKEIEALREEGIIPKATEKSGETKIDTGGAPGSKFKAPANNEEMEKVQAEL